MNGQPQPDFDRFSEHYDELLCDPVRDRFSGGGSRFFHSRKRDLIREYFHLRRVDTRNFAYLDVGCGRGELAILLKENFAKVAGCDTSPGMLASVSQRSDMELRLQDDPGRIPFEDTRFDLVTAVCVYHHVAPPMRATLTSEAHRVLKPGGIFAIIEHNPANPVTRRIVGRTPVDAGAVLLGVAEARCLLQNSGFAVEDQRYFLYFPEPLYRRVGRVERWLAKLPLGGQYAVFGRRPG